MASVASSSSSAVNMNACSPALTARAVNQLNLIAKGSNCAALGYAEYVPQTYTSQTNWPLIIALHGDSQQGTGTAADMQLLQNDGLPKQIAAGTWDVNKRFVVLAPQMNWQTRTAQQVNDFIQFAKANYRIDPTRVYLTAYDGGGGPFYRYLEAYGSVDVAAVVPISTNYTFSAAPAPCMWKLAPAWIFHGSNDTSMPMGSNATGPYDGLKACTPATPVLPKLTIYSGIGHDAWTRTYSLTGMNSAVPSNLLAYNMYGYNDIAPYSQSIYDWMLQYTLVSSAQTSSSSISSSSSVKSSSSAALSLSSSSVMASASSVAATSSVASSSSSSGPLATKLDPDFGAMTLVDSFDPTNPGMRATQSEPVGATSTQTILGRNALVLAPQNIAGSMMASYAAFTIGQNKGLVAGGTYVLEFDYPDDLPRHIVFLNRGADLVRTVATGKEFGDYREQYAFPNPESLLYPQSATWKTYRFYFTLHDRFQPLVGVRNDSDAKRPTGPADGFWVAIGHFNPKGNPMSQGAAVGEVRLYSVNSPSAATLAINYPPGGLPHRRTFWREEMNDGTAMCLAGNVTVSKDPSAANYASAGVCNPAVGTSAGTTETTWLEYKMKLAKVLGFNVFTKDLLEFGYNQGFDITRNGGANWYQPSRLSYWDNITATANTYGLEVLPYFEYYGSMGNGAFTSTACPTADAAGANYCNTAFNSFRYTCETPWAQTTPMCKLPSYGYQNNCEPLLRSTRNYTGFTWAEVACVDVSDPEALVDAKKLINAAILDIKTNASFVGAWFRTRVGSWPISFKDQARARYAADRGVSVPTKDQLRQSPSMRQDYYNWWYDKRRLFLLALRDYIRNGKTGSDGIPDANLLFTSYHEEGLPVPSPSYADAVLVTDDTSPWSAINADNRWLYRYSSVNRTTWLNNKRYDNMLSLMNLPAETIFTAGASADWQNDSPGYATPPADPARYTSDAGLYMTLPIGKQFTVDDTSLLSKFSTSNGMAMIHNFPLNEDDGTGNIAADQSNSSFGSWPMSGHFGYFVSDVERSSPYTMLTEVRGLANADPFWLGYLSSNSFNTGAPQDVRRFNAAYLAWPAIPSLPVPSASGAVDVVVRDMVTSAGKFVAVFNTGMTAKTGVQITLSATRMGSVANVQDRVTLQNLPVTSGKITLDLQVADFRVFYAP